MRFEVPQFIEVEDKIFGQLSLKQFVYMAGSLGACAIAYFYAPFIIFLILAPFLLGLGFGLAFIPVNKRPLAVLLEAILVYFSRARLYLWKKAERAPTPTPDLPLPNINASPGATRRSIASLSRNLELESLSQNNLVRDKEKGPAIIKETTNHG